MSEHLLRLQSRAETVEVSSLGYMSVNKPKWIAPRRMVAYIRYGIAQAILDNIGQSPEMLCARNIFPHHDLLDGNGDQLRTDEWVQPATTRCVPDPDEHRFVNRSPGYASNDSTIDIYSTNMNCRNHQKVYVLYGFKNLKYFSIPHTENEVLSTQAEVGGPAEVFLTSIQIMRGHVRMIDIPDMSQINDIGYIFLQQPIMYKRMDDMVIRGTTKSNAMGHTDNLKLQCIIIEALGASVTG